LAPLSHLTTSNIMFMEGENDNRGNGSDDEVAGDDINNINTAPNAENNDIKDI